MSTSTEPERKQINISTRHANAIANILRQKDMAEIADDIVRKVLEAVGEGVRMVTLDDKHHIIAWNLYKDLI